MDLPLTTYMVLLASKILLTPMRFDLEISTQIGGLRLHYMNFPQIISAKDVPSRVRVFKLFYPGTVLGVKGILKTSYL